MSCRAGDGADEGRYDQRQRDRGLQQQLAAKFVACQNVGEGQGHRRAEDNDQKTAPQRVPERFAKQRTAKKVDEVEKRQIALVVGERDPQDAQDRIKDKRQQQDEHSGHEAALPPVDGSAAGDGRCDGDGHRRRGFLSVGTQRAAGPVRRGRGATQRASASARSASCLALA